MKNQGDDNPLSQPPTGEGEDTKPLPTIARIPSDDNAMESPPSVARIPTEVSQLEAKISEKLIDDIQPLPSSRTRQPISSQPGAYPVFNAIAGMERRPSPSPPSSPVTQQGDQEGGPADNTPGLLQQQQIDDDTLLPVAAELETTAELVVSREEIEREVAKQVEDQLRQEYERKISQEYFRISRLASAHEVEASEEMVHVSTRSHAAAAAPHTTTDKPEHSPMSSASSANSNSSATIKRKWFLLVAGINLLVVIIVAIIVASALSKDNTSKEDTATTADTNTNTQNDFTPTQYPMHEGTEDDNTHTPSSTTLLPVLQAIRERGYLRCKPETIDAQKGAGFTIDLCRAIAAAIFNDPTKVEFTYVEWKEQFVAIADGRLDVSASQVSLTMGRDVRETYTHVGFSFSTPYLYTGSGLAGVPEFVQCAQEAETFANNCRHLQVCVMQNTVTQDLIAARLPGSATKLVPELADLFRGLESGLCNVVAGDGPIIHVQNAREAGYTGPYEFADKLLSHEHLALLTRQDDPVWAEVCDWIVRALVAAEALNVTDQTATDMGFWETDLFGPEYTHMFAQAIAAVGNYGQVYDRHFRDILPRSAYNSLNLMGETGLIVSDPFGTLELDYEESVPEEKLPAPVPNGTMEAVVTRGHLYCGVILEDDDGLTRSGLAEYNSTTGEWSGLDVDYCRGIAAAVSAGQTIETIFVNLSDPETRYKALANHTVDLIAGDSLTMTVDVKEPTTGLGFTFSTPYHYQSTSANCTRSCTSQLVTRQDDPQWSDLTQWTVHATFYAEEMDITRETAAEMPVVELFGTRYRQIFRDIISEAGSYGELCERNLGVLREGRNQRNVDDTAQFYPILDPF